MQSGQLLSYYLEDFTIKILTKRRLKSFQHPIFWVNFIGNVYFRDLKNYHSSSFFVAKEETCL